MLEEALDALERSEAIDDTESCDRISDIIQFDFVDFGCNGKFQYSCGAPTFREEAKAERFFGVLVTLGPGAARPMLRGFLLFTLFASS